MGVWAWWAELAGLGFRQLTRALIPLSLITRAWQGGGICWEDDQARLAFLLESAGLAVEKREQLDVLRPLLLPPPTLGCQVSL